ncbi:TnsD family Tn7-like transposition protein [Paenibacillus silvisoli]|uniref:TnsD family Tn7-like transposition protein n=1 Tax=Paenibacillus silvisoli TaxID=3110539 RepID=UPI0028063C5A|nr:TnsD family Tn7-like transposition protein [Paenibacillus silvisoli]
MVVAHFPSLYPDELLYSGVARYHQMSGNIAQKQTIKELFGNRLVCSTTDLPSHLKHLSERLGSTYTLEELIMKHTLYPYYCAFLPQEKARRVYELMSEGSSHGEAHVLLGIPASLIKPPCYLRYCSLCYMEDIARFHEPYWHRSHQLPGVCVCPVHKKALRETTVAYSTREKKFEFIALAGLSIGDSNSLRLQTVHLNKLVMVAERSTDLLQSEANILNCTLVSRRDLQLKGYITAQGRIRFQKIIEDFTAYYSSEFLSDMNCEVNGCETWLHKLIRGYDLMFHPLRHILVDAFMNERNSTIEEKFDTKKLKLIQGGRKGNCRGRAKTHTKQLRKSLHDWKKRDELVLTEVEAVVNRLRTQHVKPQRISLATVYKGVNKGRVPFFLKKKVLNKLPKTKCLLDKEIETTEQFQIRRLECASLRIINQGENIKGWRLLKEAGLNKPLRKSVEQHYNRIVSG